MHKLSDQTSLKFGYILHYISPLITCTGCLNAHNCPCSEQTNLFLNLIKFADINNLGQIQNSAVRCNLPKSYLPLSAEDVLTQVSYWTNGLLYFFQRDCKNVNDKIMTLTFC